MVTNGIESEQTVRNPKTGRFLPGNPARALGAGRPKGTKNPPKEVVERKAHKKAAELTTAALAKMRNDIEQMAGADLAIFVSTPALKFLAELVADEKQPNKDRIAAAATLLQQGHVKAATVQANLNMDAQPLTLATPDYIRNVLQKAAEKYGLPSHGSTTPQALPMADVVEAPVLRKSE